MVDTTLLGGGVALALASVPFFLYPRRMISPRAILDPVSMYESGGVSDLLAGYGIGVLLAFLGLFMAYQGVTA